MQTSRPEASNAILIRNRSVKAAVAPITGRQHRVELQLRAEKGNFVSLLRRTSQLAKYDVGNCESVKLLSH